MVTDVAGNTSTATRAFRVDNAAPGLHLEVAKKSLTVTTSDSGLIGRIVADSYDAKNKRLVNTIGSKSVNTRLERLVQ